MSETELIKEAMRYAISQLPGAEEMLNIKAENESLKEKIEELEDRMDAKQLTRQADCQWRARAQGSMNVPVDIFAHGQLLEDMDEMVLQQASNVARLPGIVGTSMAMPDAHWGYGFPIGGVAAMDAEEGVISPGGVGYDIN